MQAELKNESASESPYVQEFMDVCEKIKKIATQMNITVHACQGTEPSNFIALSTAEQKGILERLKIYSDLFELCYEEEKEKEVIEEQRLLWFALNRLKLSPSSDLFGKLKENDLFEVYVGEKQVYRSFNYYNYCTYTFDELVAVPWEFLFSRDESLTKDIFAEVFECLQTNKLCESKTPYHEVSEIKSISRKKFLYKLRFVAPLKSVDGCLKDTFVAVINAEVI